MSIKKCVNGSFVNDYYREYGTETDTITTLPKSIIADGQSASAVIKGNMVQTGTPSPSSIIMPYECGDLETTGIHAGQYKIPIPSGGTTTPVYLGEVESTRNIKQLVLTGQEDWTVETSKTYVLEGVEQTQTGYTDAICSHYALATSYTTVTTTNNTFSISRRPALFIHDDNYSSTTDFKTYLQQQYANGTPVCVWYVLATPTTGIVNEPIRKIGNYSDSVSVSNIPTTGTAEQFDVDTELKPSEVSLTYHGWHEHSDTKF